MRIKSKIKAVASLLKAKLFNKRIPLAVRWQLTNRCVLRCVYCNIWNTPKKEISLNEILCILDQLAELGTQTISFSGGEPMLRKDIGEILEQTKKRNISTEMNSTGAFIAQSIEKLKYLDFLKLSLDGPEEISQLVRQKGSYQLAIEAAEAARGNNLNFIFTTTLTKYNIKHIDFIMKIAEKYNTLIAFQPLKNLYRGVEDISKFLPTPDDYRQAISKLINLKKKNNPYLRNSLAGLLHIYNWPNYKKLACWAGKIFCVIDTDGTLYPCDRVSYNNNKLLPNCLGSSFEQSFLNLPNVYCSGCGFCGVLELNFLMALRIGTIKSILNVIR